MAEVGTNGGLTESRRRRSLYEEMRETVAACGVLGGREWEWTVMEELVCAWIAKDELVWGAVDTAWAETREGVVDRMAGEVANLATSRPSSPMRP